MTPQAQSLVDELNRLEVRFWVDGPAQPEGRVGGPARALAIAVNRTVLANAPDEGSGPTDAWDRLGEIAAPTVVACGELDVPFMVDRAVELARRLPDARHVVLGGVAHLPPLEQPTAVAELIATAVGR